ncbi:MAG: 16S rRNA (cytosine(1402)-N(4))-methyltransferase RsmH [Candidatus Omnitrophica bacterium]|nr:16S rRNA (cytosine(1402)-N(4))-methyltransferase RsmH [Candidatus Omnitrophota bacterium]
MDVHQSVLLHEVIENLNLAPGKKILDCTLGGGGHARAILEEITPGGKLIGIDQDEGALSIAAGNLKDFGDEAIFVHGNFRNLNSIFNKLDIGEVDGILFDLGLSSLQLEEKERGFSIKLDGPLDMRMNKRQKLDAAQLLNSLSELEIADILKRFGEERFAKRIARAIVRRRPVRRTRELIKLVVNAVPYKARHGRIHLATRTFQALRIAVNDELESLSSGLDAAVRFLKKNGRICVISFHSLEDRIVKNRYKDYKMKNILKIITKKPLTPQDEEVLVNPRSRSAKLRVAEKV